jgi:hypothetical protein
MIQLILFSLIGALLVFALFFAMRRGPRTEGSSTALVGARQALNSLQAGLLPPELVERIFAPEDYEFVASQAPKDVRDLFCAERKKVAIMWVDQVRQQIRSLMRFHLGSARFHAGLSLQTEIGLAVDFTGLLIACRALQVLLYLRGAYSAPRMVGATAATATRVCRISEESLAFLNAASIGGLDDRSAGAARLL